jgi:Zn-dependent M28 family amino/carboxypeptidase
MLPCLAAFVVALAQDPAPASDLSGRFEAHLRTLASDAFEGRAPGTAGEERAVGYIAEQLKAVGLEPLEPDGSWYQPVPLIGLKSRASLTFDLAARDATKADATKADATQGGATQGDATGATRIDALLPLQAVVSSRSTGAPVALENSAVVFVGYGVVAPEYGWDDYKGLDCRGKTLVMLVNDPPVEDPKQAGKLDESMFRGRAMTYYGRWTYKYEVASEKGAAACLIVHETGPAGYPFAVVSGSFGRENFDLDDPHPAPRVAAEGWLAEPFARELLKGCGQDFDALKRAAASKDFKPIALGASARIAIANETRKVASRNVAGVLRGSDDKRKDEWLVVSAHWDHLGRDDALAGDKIYNGAADNASGSAALLALAERLARGPERPQRSILFLAVTAEEKGLLGSRWYSEHPLVPLERTLMNLNIDGINLRGRTRDSASVGYGVSTLDEIVTRHAAAQQRTVHPETEPEKGTYYRSDHFHFARMGVPALYLGSGIDYVGRPAGWGQQQRDAYTQNDYHKPSDEVREDWDYTGALEDIELMRAVLLDVGAAERWPEWNEGAEFKGRRDAMLGRVRR